MLSFIYSLQYTCRGGIKAILILQIKILRFRGLKLIADSKSASVFGGGMGAFAFNAMLNVLGFEQLFFLPHLIGLALLEKKTHEILLNFHSLKSV